ncbi:peroxiredoxin [Amaricoccus sp.]|uniref:peroxiredoxin n=1 Tax=Amaricoccus sp. TaxID=1872485 RepID=UPI002604FF4B|nr:peroxiredoxin [uncultured Amaricoccus sp.]
MVIAVGDRIPEAILIQLREGEPETVPTEALFSGRRVVLFAVPGAFTGVCSTQHVPSFIRVADAIRARGVDEIFCLAVNDPFVLRAWDASTGASGAGIRMLADPAGELTRALGMDFSNADRGLIGRSKRYAMLVDQGVVKVLNVEAAPGACEISAGETLLAAL